MESKLIKLVSQETKKTILTLKINNKYICFTDYLFNKRVGFLKYQIIM